MTDVPARDVSGLLPPKARRKPRIGLVAGGALTRCVAGDLLL